MYQIQHQMTNGQIFDHSRNVKTSIFVVLQIGSQRIHTVRTMGGNKKYRALRLDQGNFAWGSEGNFTRTLSPF